MRAGAGLGFLALLVGVALMFYFFASFEIPKIKAGKAAEQRVKPMVGLGQDNLPATQSFDTTGQMRGNRFVALQVTSVTPGGAMDGYYGLRVGDEIVAIDGTGIETLSNGDEGLAKDMVVSHGLQRQRPITVRRGGQRVELAFMEPTPNAGAPAQAQQAPAQPTRPDGNSLQRQLQGIQNSAGGEQ